MLTGFTVEKYRSFARPTTVELRPLTLLFGYNSSGKSALLRFLPLLQQSLEAPTPLALKGDVLRNARFYDVACRSTGSREIRFTLHGTEAELSVTLRGDSTGHAVDSFRLQSPSGVTTWDGESAASFTGWAPLEASAAPVVSGLVNATRRVQWVRGLRATPERWREFPLALPGAMKSDGVDAGDWLAADGLRSGVPAPETVSADVDRFYAGVDLRLTVSERPDQYQVVASPRNSPGLTIPLVDGGEGFLQVLPVLVACARARRGGPEIVAIEQPEIHLHTAAQAVLGRWLAAQASQGTSARLLVETHSEVLLTSVQLAIARGEVASDSVVAYWISRNEEGESTAARVTFDAKARPQGVWPPNLFGDVARLARELYAARSGSRDRS